MKDYAHARRLRQREVFVPLRHDPGHAQVAGSKYADGLPLYRQEGIYARDGV